MRAIKIALQFIVFNIILACITLPLLTIYGPFSRVRTMLGETLMTTMHHRSLARIFLSSDEAKAMENDRFDSYKTAKASWRFLPSSRSKNGVGVELYNVSGRRFKGKVIIVNDPKMVKVAYSKTLPKIGESVSHIVKREGAIAGINAGGFGDYNGTGTGGWPEGLIVHDGRFIYSAVNKEDAELRVVGFTQEGLLVAGTSNLRDLKHMGIREAVSFGPVLVDHGRPMIKDGDGGWGIAPRSGIGQTKDGRVILAALDGRQIGSIGATLKDLQDVLIEYGAYTAANLDGGSSSTLYYKDRIVNSPSDPMGERLVPTAFIVKE